MKKLISLLLTIALILSVCAFPVMAASTATSAQIQVLTDLGVIKGYEDGSFRPDAVITRAEVVAIINRIQGLSDAAKAASGVSIYSDVKATDWFAGDVNLATQMGIISGDGDGLFRPDDQVKYEEAVKMFVAALGYNQEYVLKQGGWPTGYLVIATQHKITEGLSVQAGEPAYRGIVAKLAYQSLTAPMMVLASYDDEGKATYKADPSKTLLGTKLNVSKLTGYAAANASSAIKGEPTKNKDRIKIQPITDDVAVEFITNKDYALGHIYDFYLKASDDDFCIVTAEEGKYEAITLIENEECKIESKDNQIIVTDSDDNETEYSLNKDEDKNLNIVTLVNGDVSPLPTDFATNDIIELVDYDRDSDYDFVFITTYEIGIVNSIYSNNTKIGFKNDVKPIHINEKEEYSYSITLNGKPIAIEDLMEYDVLTIARSKSDKIIDIIVSRDIISGEVDAVDNYDKIYSINGKDYGVSIAADAPSLNLGLEGTFYLDSFGKIAWHKGQTSYSGNIAYVVGTNPITSTRGDTIEIEILTKNGKFETYNLGNGVSEPAIGSVISYKTKNSAISFIEVLTPEQSIDLLEYDSSTNSFDNIYGVNESTIIFFVGGDNIDNYTVGNINNLVDEKTYDISIIETDEEYTTDATILVIESVLGDIADDASLAILSKVKEVSLEDGIGYELTFLTNGKITTLDTYFDCSDQEIYKSGTVFVYSTDEEGYIDDISIVPALDNAKIVENKSGNIITLADNGRVNIGNVENIYLVDLDKSKIVPTVGAIGDIIKSKNTEGDICVKAYIKYVDEKPFEMVVYFKTND